MEGNKYEIYITDLNLSATTSQARVQLYPKIDKGKDKQYVDQMIAHIE